MTPVEQMQQLMAKFQEIAKTKENESYSCNRYFSGLAEGLEMAIALLPKEKRNGME